MATGSVTKRKAAISLNTPIFFSPFLSHDPPPFPNYKARCIYHWVNTNKTAHRRTQTHTDTHTHTNRHTHTDEIPVALSVTYSMNRTAQLHRHNKHTHMQQGLQIYTHAHRLNGACTVIRMWVIHTHLFKCADWRWLPSHTVWLQTVLFYFVLMRAVTKYQVWWSWTLN